VGVGVGVGLGLGDGVGVGVGLGVGVGIGLGVGVGVCIGVGVGVGLGVGFGVGLGVGVGVGCWHNSISKRTTYQGSVTKNVSRFQHKTKPCDLNVPSHIEPAAVGLAGPALVTIILLVR
jgi:hypothetical protein